MKAPHEDSDVAYWNLYAEYLGTQEREVVEHQKGLLNGRQLKRLRDASQGGGFALFEETLDQEDGTRPDVVAADGGTNTAESAETSSLGMYVWGGLSALVVLLTIWFNRGPTPEQIEARRAAEFKVFYARFLKSVRDPGGDGKIKTCIQFTGTRCYFGFKDKKTHPSDPEEEPYFAVFTDKLEFVTMMSAEEVMADLGIKDPNAFFCQDF